MKTADSALSEQHVYPTPSLIAAPRAVELTVIEDNFYLYLPLAFSAALFVSGLHLVQPGSLVQRSWQVISCSVRAKYTSVNLQFAKLEQPTYGPMG